MSDEEHGNMDEIRITKGVARYRPRWYQRAWRWIKRLFLPTPISERHCRTCKSLTLVTPSRPRVCMNIWRLYNAPHIERSEKGKCGPTGAHYRRDRHAPKT